MLYIIRHGQTELNVKKVLQGRSNNPLNEEGLKQAGAAAERLAAMGIAIDKIYASPLLRAVQTAERIADGADVVTDGRLVEMGYGQYEGLGIADLPPEAMAFLKDFAGTPEPEGMEPLADVVARLGDFLEEVRGEAERGNVLVVTHGVAMRGIFEYLTPDPRGGNWYKFIGNCEIYAVEIKDGRYGAPYRLE